MPDYHGWKHSASEHLLYNMPPQKMENTVNKKGKSEICPCVLSRVRVFHALPGTPRAAVVIFHIIYVLLHPKETQIEEQGGKGRKYKGRKLKRQGQRPCGVQHRATPYEQRKPPQAPPGEGMLV